MSTKKKQKNTKNSTAKKAVKKTVKTVTKKTKPAPKKKAQTPPKKLKKSTPKPVKKSAKVVKKPLKKTLEKKSTTKKETKKTVVKSKNTESKSNLAKNILAKSNSKKTEAKKVEVKIETPKKPFEAAKNIKKPETKGKNLFKVGDFAIYPSHGIGKIVDIEKITIHDQDFSCYLMYFEREKLTIKIPVSSIEKIGLRHLVSKAQMDEVFVTLRSGVKKLKGMWSRRAQEYETKINSGDIMLLAEVLRDLTRDIEDGDRSYSERIIYETAIIRLASEYSAIYGVTFEEAKDKIILTAKDKINSEGKIIQNDDFDDIDDMKDSDSDEDEDEDEDSEDDEDDEGDDDDDYFDDDDDDAPKKRKRK